MKIDDLGGQEAYSLTLEALRGLPESRRQLMRRETPISSLELARIERLLSQWREDQPTTLARLARSPKVLEWLNVDLPTALFEPRTPDSTARSFIAEVVRLDAVWNLARITTHALGRLRYADVAALEVIHELNRSTSLPRQKRRTLVKPPRRTKDKSPPSRRSDEGIPRVARPLPFVPRDRAELQRALGTTFGGFMAEAVMPANPDFVGEWVDTHHSWLTESQPSLAIAPDWVRNLLRAGARRLKELQGVEA